MVKGNCARLEIPFDLSQFIFIFVPNPRYLVKQTFTFSLKAWIKQKMPEKH